MLPKKTEDVHADDDSFDQECPQCGKDSITTRWILDSFKYGTGDSAVTLQVDLPVRSCHLCDLQFLDHEGESLRHEAVCRHLGILSPAEVLGIRKVYGMTRSAFAEITGLGEATLSRWENGAVIQNLANDRYLRLLSLPGVMASLKEQYTSKYVSQSGFRNRPRFQVLTNLVKYRKRQDNFQLRRAS